MKWYTVLLTFVIVSLDKTEGGSIVPNIYDSAYDLEKAIRSSEEFTRLKNAYDAVMADESAKQMFDNFRNTQMALQEKQMQGQDISEEEVEQARKVVELVQQHEDISKLMEEEQRLNVVINDVIRFITKPLEELYGNPEEETNE
jgi:cell fate (sporulation/competence/biofilm development) regulator YlbF (YheA/YmcA/DUF963 family)